MVLAGMLAVSCAGPGSFPGGPTTTAPDATDAYGRGEYEDAARAWEREALTASARDAASLRVRAADAWALAGRYEQAASTLDRVPTGDLTSHYRSLYGLVRADLALRAGRANEAEALLDDARSGLPRAMRPRYENLRAEVAETLSSPMYRGLAAVARQIDGMTRYDPVATVALLKSLETVSSGELAIRAENPRAPRQLTGWLDLALVIRENLVDGSGIEEAVAAWKQRQPYHLLTDKQALDAWLRYRQEFVHPRKVAVLLPGSGRLEAASDALRDGLLSAYLEDPGGAELRFFATGDDNQSAISAYFNALDAGAEWIIGPLRKESVEGLVTLPGMVTPVLALNDLPEEFLIPPGMDGQLWGVSLSQENEAAAAARYALGAGYRRAMVLAPEGEWGERMAAAFEGEFLREDTEVVADTRYVETENDHSAVLERALKIDESKARMRQLEQTLQMNVEFEPSRRDDIDVIFLAANATQAKLIRPQLKFLDAGDVPLVTTGRAYSGRPDPVRNQDLNGLVFAAAPWQVEHAEPDQQPGLESIKDGALGSLYALGRDSWNLLPWLDLMHKDPEFRFPGASGNYRSRGRANLERDPEWAQFRHGIPVALPETSPNTTTPAVPPATP